MRNLVYACIAKNPAERPSSAAHLARAATALRRGDIQAAAAAVPAVLGDEGDTSRFTTLLLPGAGAAAAVGDTQATTLLSANETEEAVEDPTTEKKKRSPWTCPLIALIAPELHLRPGIAGLIVTLTQLGYAGGLLFVVPLADRVENRKLILATIGIVAVALAALAAAPSAEAFLAASVAVGFCSAGVQVVIPFAASLAREETRGRTIGNVMSGLLAGIMLARPVASLIAEVAGWRAVFGVSAAAMRACAGASATAPFAGPVVGLPRIATPRSSVRWMFCRSTACCSSFCFTFCTSFHCRSNCTIANPIMTITIASTRNRMKSLTPKRVSIGMSWHGHAVESRQA